MRAFAAAFSCLAICLTAANLDSRLAADQQLPLSAQQVLGAWVGYDESCLKFYRLTLTAQGTGVCVVLFNEEVSGRYRVSWSLRENKVLLELASIDQHSERVVATVATASSLRFEITIRGLDRMWERTATLYNERELQRRLRLCTRLERKATGPSVPVSPNGNP